MGFCRRRAGRDGRPRYTAYYLDTRGRERPAGAFGCKKDAEDAWKNAEAAIRAGRRGDPRRGKRLFEDYVLADWLPHHQLEPGSVTADVARERNSVPGDLTRIGLAEPQPHQHTRSAQVREEPNLVPRLLRRICDPGPEHRTCHLRW